MRIFLRSRDIYSKVQQDTKLFFRLDFSLAMAKIWICINIRGLLVAPVIVEKATLSFHRNREINHARCSFCLNRTNVGLNRAIVQEIRNETNIVFYFSLRQHRKSY